MGSRSLVDSVRRAALLVLRVAVLALSCIFFLGTLRFIVAGGDALAITSVMGSPPPPPLDNGLATWMMHLSFLGNLPAIAYALALVSFTDSRALRSSQALRGVILLQLALLVCHIAAYVQMGHVAGMSAFLAEHAAPAAAFAVVFTALWALAPAASPLDSPRKPGAVDELVTLFLYSQAFWFAVQAALVGAAAFGAIDLQTVLNRRLPAAVAVINDAFGEAAWQDAWTRFQLCNWLLGHGLGIAVFYYSAATSPPGSPARHETMAVLAVLHVGLVCAHAMLLNAYEHDKQLTFVQQAYSSIYFLSGAGTLLSHTWSSGSWGGVTTTSGKDKDQ